MPRDLTHVILADDTRQLLSKQARVCTYKNRAAFHMGSISPDSFLYGLHSKHSTVIHGGFGDDTRAVVLEMLDDVRQEKIPKCGNMRLNRQRRCCVKGISNVKKTDFPYGRPRLKRSDALWAYGRAEYRRFLLFLMKGRWFPRLCPPVFYCKKRS